MDHTSTTVLSPSTIPIHSVHAGHKCLLRKINQVVDFSFVTELVKDRYTPDFGRPDGKAFAIG